MAEQTTPLKMLFKDIANAIREKVGSIDPIYANTFAECIHNLKAATDFAVPVRITTNRACLLQLSLDDYVQDQEITSADTAVFIVDRPGIYTLKYFYEGVYIGEDTVTVVDGYNRTFNTYMVTTCVNDNSFGSVTKNTLVVSGESVTITAVANEGYEFSHWLVNGNEVLETNSYTFAPDVDTTIQAIFRVKATVTTVTIKFQTGSGYTAATTVLNTTNLYISGDGVTYTRISNSGQQIQISSDKIYLKYSGKQASTRFYVYINGSSGPNINGTTEKLWNINIVDTVTLGFKPF